MDVDGDCATILQRVQMQATVMGQDRSGTFCAHRCMAQASGRLAGLAQKLHAPRCRRNAARLTWSRVSGDRMGIHHSS